MGNTTRLAHDGNPSDEATRCQLERTATSELQDANSYVGLNGPGIYHSGLQVECFQTAGGIF